jgi:EamA-like transporter family
VQLAATRFLLRRDTLGRPSPFKRIELGLFVETGADQTVRRRQSVKAPLFDVALQAIVQGLLTAIVALLLYGRIVSILGATGGAAFVALMPAMTALMGIPILGEWPSASDWVAVAVISSGVYLVPGGRFRHADDVGIIPIVCDEIRARNPARFLPNIGIMILSG